MQDLLNGDYQDIDSSWQAATRSGPDTDGRTGKVYTAHDAATLVR